MRLRVAYTLTIQNNGPAIAHSVVVTDWLPRGVSFDGVLPVQGTCTGTRQIVCNLGTVDSGAQAMIVHSWKGATRPARDCYEHGHGNGGSRSNPNSANNTAYDHNAAGTLPPLGAVPLEAYVPDDGPGITHARLALCSEVARRVYNAHARFRLERVYKEVIRWQNCFGMSYTRDELIRHMGDIAQVGGVRLGELGDGAERGVRVADFRTGSGFDFTVHLDRGLDIGAAHYRDVALAWRSPAPVVHPGLYEPAGLGWLRGFSGGLMTTCGLTTYGAPSVDQGQELGLHGRASYIPATHVAYGGDVARRRVRDVGERRAARGRPVRRLPRASAGASSARLGEARLTIEDSVTNEGYRSSPHMLLYHCNFRLPNRLGRTPGCWSTHRCRARSEVGRRHSGPQALPGADGRV